MRTSKDSLVGESLHLDIFLHYINFVFGGLELTIVNHVGSTMFLPFSTSGW